MVEGEELPEGWAEVALDSLNSADAPICYGVLKPGASPPDGIPMLRVKDVRDGTLDTSEVVRISAALDREFQRSRLETGDVLITVQGSVGRVAVVPPEMDGANISRTIARIRPTGGATAPWIALSLRGPQLQAQIGEETGGTTRDSLNIRDLREVKVAVPPLAEQRRIIEKVEALLAEVNAAHDRLAKVPAVLKRFRQSVLAAACDGRLTEAWREADDEGDLPGGWRWEKAGNLVVEGGIFDGPFGSSLKTADYTDRGVRVIRMENIAHLRFIESKRTYISKEKYASLTRHTVGKGDIIVASFVEDEVRACVLPELATKAIAKADCFCVRANTALVEPHYLAMQLASRESYDAVHEDIHGATRPRINTKQIRELLVRLCPLPEQREIIRRVDALVALVDTIEQHVAAATARADKLTQSILAKAFRGELVPTEAELARREGRDYEPASVLLERVRGAGVADADGAGGAAWKRKARGAKAARAGASA